MPSYTAPIKDMQFVLNELAGLKQIQALPGCEDATDETVAAVLEENARFMGEVVAPLNRTGDVEPARWDNGRVITTPGFKQAFDAFVQAGWQGVPSLDARLAHLSSPSKHIVNHLQ